MLTQSSGLPWRMNVAPSSSPGRQCGKCPVFYMASYGDPRSVATRYTTCKERLVRPPVGSVSRFAQAIPCRENRPFHARHRRTSASATPPHPLPERSQSSPAPAAPARAYRPPAATDAPARPRPAVPASSRQGAPRPAVGCHDSVTSTVASTRRG